jgi:hypothetical protein
VGGDAEAEPATLSSAVIRADATSAELRAPAGGGDYRLFAYVYDGKGGAATANIPFQVLAPAASAEARAAKLPLAIYAEASDKETPFTPSGWMGNTKGLKLAEDCKERPHSGKTCLRLSYEEADGWAGIVWQSPANDWGDRAGGWNLTGARRLVFWARGAAGGETASFEFGILKPGGKKFHDSGSGKLASVVMSSDWKEYSIDLTGKDLRRIKTGFVCVLAGRGKPMTIYLDDLRYE